ncbi:MAG: carbohydrate kinase family protein [Gemmatimonadaceae bacterium]
MTLPLPPIFPRVDNPAVVVVGGANIDQKWRTQARAVIGSSNPATVRSSSGGVGRNVAENLARMGVTSALITAVGDDADGDRVRRDTDAAGVDTRYIIVTPLPTGVYTVVLDGSGEMVIAVSAMEATRAISADEVNARRALIANCRFLVLDCNVSTSALIRAVELAADNDVPVIIDPVSVPKVASISAILAAGLPLHTITPNLDEMFEITGASGSGRAELCAAAAQLHAANVRNVWISLGPSGSFLSVLKDGTQRVEMIAALPATLVDATGAGDAMLAGYITGLLRGLDEFAAVRLGRAAAAITIESAETVNPSMNLAALLARADATSEVRLG